MTQEAPRTDGPFVIWYEVPFARIGGSLLGADLRDRRVFQVSGGPVDIYYGAAGSYDIDSGIVVWAERGAIRGKDLVSGRELGVDTTTAVAQLPAIGDGWAAWVTWIEQRQTILARDVRAMSGPVTVAQIETGWSISGGPLRVDSDRVLWGEIQVPLVDGALGNPATTGRWRLRVAPVRGGSTPVTITEGEPWGQVPRSHTYDLVGDRIFLVELGPSPTIITIDLRTGERRPIVAGTAFTTDGGHLFYREGSRLGLMGYAWPPAADSRQRPTCLTVHLTCGAVSWSGNEADCRRTATFGLLPLLTLCRLLRYHALGQTHPTAATSPRSAVPLPLASRTSGRQAVACPSSATR